MYKRGDVFWADLSPVIGSEQDGVRPVVILQNDIGNKYSPTVIVAPLTSNLHRDKHLVTHVPVCMQGLSLIHISEPTRRKETSRMPSSA